MPSIPPAVLPTKEANEIASAPNRVTAYPPAKEPASIPAIMIDFRDIAGSVDKREEFLDEHSHHHEDDGAKDH